MPLVEECALAHTRSVLASKCTRQVVVGLSPSDDLTCGEGSMLELLVFLPVDSVLAPPAFALALLAIISDILNAFIVHFEHLVVRARLLRLFFFRRNPELVQIRVFHCHFMLQTLDFFLRHFLGVSCFVLVDRKMRLQNNLHLGVVSMHRLLSCRSSRESLCLFSTLYSFCNGLKIYNYSN